MANWNDLGQGSNWGADMLRFDYGPTAPTGAGQSYAGVPPIMRAGTQQPGYGPLYGDPGWVNVPGYAPGTAGGGTMSGNTGLGFPDQYSNLPYSSSDLYGPSIPHAGPAPINPSIPGSPRASWSEGLPWASPAGGGGRGAYGGGFGQLPNGIPIQSEFMNRLRSILTNPSSIEGDPEYQWLVSQGEKALGRSAGARRLRFSGKSMTDFLDYGQKAANQYTGDIQGRLRSAATSELPFLQWNAEAEQARKVAKAVQSDPYGRARQLASRYPDPYTAYSAMYPGNITNKPSLEQFVSQFNLGKELLG